MVGLLVMALAWGCGLAPGRGADRGKPAYADLDRLTLEQPGWKQVRQLEGQIERLRSRLRAPGGPDPEALLPVLPPLAPLSAPAGRGRQETSVGEQTRELAAGQLAMLRAELTRTREEKLATYEHQLRQQLGRDVAAEKRRQEELLWRRRQEVLRRFSRGLLSQRGKVELLAAADPRREQEAAKLAALEAEQKEQLAALQAETDGAMADFARARETDLQQKLLDFRAELVSQGEQRLQEASARADSRIAEAERALASSLQTEPSPELSLDLGPVSEEMTARSRKLRAEQRSDQASQQAELVRLEQLRDRLKAALRRETAETATALAGREGYRVVFDPKKGRRLRDITPELSRWLNRWNHAPGAGASQTGGD